MNEFRWILLGLAIVVFLVTLIWSSVSKIIKLGIFFNDSGFGDIEKDVVYADDHIEIEEDFGVSEVRVISSKSLDETWGDELNAAKIEAVAAKNKNSDPNLESDISHSENLDDQSESSNEDSQHIVVLHVAAREGDAFKGSKVCKTLEHLGLRHGKYKIYHRESLQNPDISLFSVANMVKPGYFEPDSPDSFTTPGLSFFLVLPGPPDPVTTFNEMVQTARQVAQTLNGELLDSERSTFTNQRAQLIQEEIVNFVHRLNED